MAPPGNGSWSAAPPGGGSRAGALSDDESKAGLSSGDGSRVVKSPVGGSRVGVLPDGRSRDNASSKRQILGGGVPGGGLRAGTIGFESDASGQRSDSGVASGQILAQPCRSVFVGASAHLRGGGGKSCPVLSFPHFL